jgi:GTP cyclohydrolase II
MLQDLGITKLDLLTNNLSKVKYLKQHRVSVTRVPLLPEAICSSGYQQTEARKLGQFIPFV